MNKKILALAAVTLMAVPAFAAASFLNAGRLGEQLVEGHTVFAVIQVRTTTNRTFEAAAVAVLVRERAEVNELFKGVLWFNDQFLLAPFNSTRVSQRFPCGGAVLAVNSGDADPRQKFISVNGVEKIPGFNPTNLAAAGTPDTPFPPNHVSPNNPPGPSNFGSAPGYGDGGSALDVNTGTNTVSTDATTGVFNYIESYQLLDPNDHNWIIDGYLGVTQQSVVTAPAPGVAPAVSSAQPIFAVNILGSPVFVPDDGITSCPPFVDDPRHQGAINTLAAGTPAAGAANIGYYETTDPTVNGGASYCYNGDAANPSANPDEATPGKGCDHGTSFLPETGNTLTFPFNTPAVNSHTPATPHPLREYNALIFGYLCDDNGVDAGVGYNVYCPTPVHFRVTIAPTPHGATDTNGCEVGTEWVCPAGNDNAEGNSHPFNPIASEPLNLDETTIGTSCSVPQKSNDPDASGVFGDDKLCNNNPALPCYWNDHQCHDRASVDLYFDGGWRPAEPPVRNFAVTDPFGSDDVWHGEDSCVQHSPCA